MPPPGAGFVTVTLTDPTVTISAAAMAAVNCVALLKVVVLEEPLNFTIEFDTNPDPLTVSVNAAPPAVEELGESDASEGVGLFTLKT